MKPLVLPLPPSSNHRLMVVRGRLITSPKARAYKEAVAIKALAQGMRPTPRISDVDVTMHVYRARKQGDLDNYFKLVFDALKGVAWEDDRQVVFIEAWRHEDKANPRIEVWVYPAHRDREPS